jgi:predicted HicB family RNase H-like nuclease
MSKQITLRLPDELHERLKAAAGHDHRSLHAQVLVYVERGLDQDQEEQRRAG